jgi:hypothetical protein
MSDVIHRGRLIEEFCWITSGVLTELGMALVRACEQCVDQLDDIENVEAVSAFQIVWTTAQPGRVILRVRYFGGKEVISGAN